MKVTSKILSILLLSCVFAVSFCIGSPALELGDVDADGNVTAGDARLTLRYSVGLEEFSDDAVFRADIDSSGGVFSSDARTILRISVGLAASREIKSEYDMLRSGVFSYKGERLDPQSGKYEYFELARTKDSVHLLTSFEGVSLAMLLKNDTIYMVSHDKQAYLITPDEVFSTLGIDKNALLKGYSENAVSYPALKDASSVTNGKVEGYNCKIYRITKDGITTEVSLCGNRLIRLREYDRKGVLTGDTKFYDVSMVISANEKNIPSHYKKYEGKAEALLFVAKLLNK